MSTVERLYIEINIRKIDIELIGGGFRSSGGVGSGDQARLTDKDDP